MLGGTVLQMASATDPAVCDERAGLHGGRRRWRLLITTGALFAALAGTVVAAGSASAKSVPAASGTVTIVHGVRGLVADVAVDRERVLTGFSAARVTDPLTLSPGRHTVAVTQTGSGSGPALTAQITVPVNSLQTVAVGLTTAGQRKIFVYRETTVALAGEQGALTVRHVAAVPPVQILVDGKPFGGTLADGDSTTASLPPGKHQVLVRAHSEGGVVLPQREVSVTPGTVTSIYLTGSTSEGSVSWVATTRDAQINTTLLRGIPTGDGSSLAVASSSHQALAIALLSLAGSAFLAVGAAPVAARRRRSA